MSEKQYRDQISRYTKELADLKKREADANTATRKARSDAASYRAKIKPSTSPTMARSYQRSADSADKRAATSEQKVVALAKQIADCTKKLNTAQSNLSTAIKSSERKGDQEAARRRRTELDHARKVSRLSRPVVRHVHEIREVPAPRAEELRLLYLTSNPLVDDPSMNLRVDAEVARVQRAVRGALHREYVQIAHRPAASPQDLLDGLNDLRPHVVHFSGHGGDGALVMDNSDVIDPQPHDVTLERLGRALGTLDQAPVLLVLNACDTAGTATDDLLPTVPIVIAMADSVSDEAAATFAAQFYAAIASGLPVKKAFDQAVLAVEFGGLAEESWMITIIQREDVDPEQVVLVRPPMP